MYRKKTIEEYLKALASRAPAPGGGSAAALVGAIGVACLTKMVSFTIGNEKYKNVESDMKSYLKDLRGLELTFQKLCSDDARAYGELSKAFKMPRNEERTKKIQESLKEAMAVPFEVCKKAHEAIKLCRPVARKGNKNLVSDADSAKSILKCAYETAVLNVEINLKSIKDEQFVAETKKTLETLKGDMT